MLEAALQWAELGYPIFPLQAGRKRPFAGSHGLLDATTDIEQIEKWWTATPDANIAIRTDGLLIVDVDGEEGTAWLLENPELAADLAAAPISKSANEGRHYWFRQPEGTDYSNTASKIAPKVDTRANGGYLVVPPSRLVGGREYIWIEGYAVDCKPGDLPEPPEWLLKLLGEASKKQLAEIASGEIVAGTQNDTLWKLACSMRRVGMEFPEIHAAISTVGKTRCKPQADPQKTEDICRRAAKYEPEQAAALVAHGVGIDFSGIDADDVSKEPEGEDPGPFPRRLLNVPGIIGDVIEYTNSIAHRRQPVISLAGSIALVSTLTGRVISDPKNTRTNLYILATAGSGSGKDMPRSVNKDILTAAGLDDLIGEEGIASHSGLVAMAANYKRCLVQLDEIGRFLNTLGNASKSPHLYNITSVLMKLYSSAGSTFIGDGYADRKHNKRVNQPHVVLFGTTVPDSLFGGFTAENLSDGLISRMIIFEGDKLPDLQDAPFLPPPDSIIKAVREWGEFNPSGGLLGRENPRPAIWDYTAEAADQIREFQSKCDCNYRASKAEACSLWTRAAEKARKLAMVYSASQGPNTGVIEDDAATWGIDMADYLTRRLLFLANSRVSRNSIEDDKKRVLRLIAESGERGITKSLITRKTQYLRNANERDAIIKDLVEAKLIECRAANQISAGGGKSSPVAALVYKTV